MSTVRHALSIFALSAFSLVSVSAFAAPAKKSAPVKEAKPPVTKPVQEGKKMSANIVKATIKTSLGNIVVELDKEKAPLTVENFVTYAKSGFFEKTVFHRVINGFMIQGGGFNEKMEQKPTKSPLKNEATNGLKNDRGTLAMARTSDPNSATAQFFINLVNNDFLNYGAGNPGYAVFGHVTEGMNVVDEMAKVKTGNFGMMGDVPVKPIVMESVTIEN